MKRICLKRNRYRRMWQKVWFMLTLCCFIYINKVLADNGTLKAGSSKINITPKTDEPIHDSVYARSLVLDVNGKRLAFVSVDLVIFVSDRIEQVCLQKYNITKVILSSKPDTGD